MGGAPDSEKASLREALRNRGGAKALVTPAQSEAEDNEDSKSGLAWLDLNAFSSTAMKQAIGRLKSDVEQQIDRVRNRGETDAEASANEDAGPADGASGYPESMSSALAGMMRGVATGSSSGSKPSKAPAGGLKAALQARGGIRRQDPQVLADLERVAEALENIEGAEESSPSASPVHVDSPSGPPRLPAVDEEEAHEEATTPFREPSPDRSVSPLRAQAEDPPEPSEAAPATPAPTPEASADASSPLEASPRDASPPPEAAEDSAAGAACATSARSSPLGQASQEAPPTGGEQPPVVKSPTAPQKLKFASLGADAWWLHEGKKAEPRGSSASVKEEIESKADPRLNRAKQSTKEPGKLNTLQEFWGGAGKKSQGFAAGPQLEGSKGRMSKVEAQAALQRLISAGSDFDEVRRLRKLISQLDDSCPGGT